MSDIKQLDSKVVYQNKWMTVREDKILRPSGAEGIYGVVDKPDCAAILAIDNGMIHLVQQYRYTVGQRCWEIHKGRGNQTQMRIILSLPKASCVKKRACRRAPWRMSARSLSHTAF